MRPGVSLNKHQLRTQATRKKLLAAAYRVFARQGFEAARIEDISTEAGYTRGAFYANFKAKEDLFFALLEQEAGRHIERLHASLERCGDDEQRLGAFRDFYTERATDRQWTVLVLEFKLYAIRHSKLRAKLAEAHRIRRALALRPLEGVIPLLHQACEGFEARKVGLEAALTGLVIEHAYDPKRISESEVRSLLRCIFDALVAPQNLTSNLAEDFTKTQ
jgi:AcrR family transcriptional regulator